MRAAWFDHFGSAKEVLEIGDIDTPVAASGEVLVRLHTSGINPSDVKKRAGSFANLLDDGFVIPNSDGAGIIEAVGDGVDANRIGERVWVYQAQYARRFGTAAEYVAIDARRAPRLPDNVSFEVGACLGIPVMTAHRAVFADGPVAGQTLLITAQPPAIRRMWNLAKRPAPNMLSIIAAMMSPPIFFPSTATRRLIALSMSSLALICLSRSRS
jgi:NADPH2:quinone reductase